VLDSFSFTEVTDPPVHIVCSQDARVLQTESTRTYIAHPLGAHRTSFSLAKSHRTYSEIKRTSPRPRRVGLLVRISNQTHTDLTRVHTAMAHRSSRSASTQTIRIHSNLVRCPQELSKSLQRYCGDSNFSVEMRNDVYVVHVQISDLSDTIRESVRSHANSRDSLIQP
jgi:hypothetical protein